MRVLRKHSIVSHWYLSFCAIFRNVSFLMSSNAASWSNSITFLPCCRTHRDYNSSKTLMGSSILMFCNISFREEILVSCQHIQFPATSKKKKVLGLLMTSENMSPTYLRHSCFLRLNESKYTTTNT